VEWYGANLTAARPVWNGEWDEVLIPLPQPKRSGIQLNYFVWKTAHEGLVEIFSTGLE
jgi:hypothetical protein